MTSINRELNAVGFSQRQVAALERIFAAQLIDSANIRTAITTLTAKLDTDATAQNAAVTSSQLDTDYAATVDPAALTVTT
jgi:hypothetical protein